jgi:CheY-like chemotaxis protein
MVKLPQIRERSQAGERRLFRIFLVENHENTAEYLKLYLEGLGHSVILSRNMESALDSFPKSSCDLLISDITLPDGNGWELMQRLRALGRFEAIAMSGHADIHDIKRSKAVGYKHHLVKPFTPELLEAVILEIGASSKDQGVF